MVLQIIAELTTTLLCSTSPEDVIKLQNPLHNFAQVTRGNRMEWVGPVARIVQCLCTQNCIQEPISRRCSYLKEPQAIIEMLDEKLKLLIARQDDVLKELNLERIRNGLEPKAEVNFWLENVYKVKTSVHGNKSSGGMEDRKCTCGCLPNYCRRIDLGKFVEEKITEIDKLLELRKDLGSSLVNNALPKLGRMLPETILVGETSSTILETTWQCLMDADIGRIGVYGMGGVGKTIIVMCINNRVLREGAQFDNIIWITASKESDAKKLQKDIAKEVDLYLHDDDGEMKRASQLLQALRRRGRFLLIIDDLWESFSLESIGIPNPKVEKSCKVLITTRSLRVCQDMETDQTIRVELLRDEEAWELFEEKVGKEVLLTASIQDVAKNVAQECGGLPLAVITVGRALRNENDIEKWKHALTELRSSKASLLGMEEKVLMKLRFSYERLRNGTTKSCFLYCALYPKGHLIDTEELIYYWIWEGLLGDHGSLKDMMHVGKSIINELKSACLLDSVHQDNTDDEYVKMHDLVRDMAIDITRVSPLFLVRAGQGLRHAPFEYEWHGNLERVSLMRNNLCELVCRPYVYRLSTLLLQYNSIKGMAPDFFSHMESLKVLDLSYTAIYELPESLILLRNLHALLLCSCWNLQDAPIVKGLTSLRVLDLSYSRRITKIPYGMEMLVNLRCLALSYSPSVNDFPIGFLLKYKFLENLAIIGLKGYKTKEFRHVITNVNLSALQVNFRTLEDFYHYVGSGTWMELSMFKIYIGDPPHYIHLGRNSLGIYGIRMPETGNHLWSAWRMHELLIQKCSGITHLPIYIASSACQLKCCRILRCTEMEWIVTAGESIFCDLEQLVIEGLSNLRKICNGNRPSGSFSSLKILHVSSCQSLKTLIPFELVEYFQNLEEIEAEKCELMEEIIAPIEECSESSEVAKDNINLAKLQKLKLSSLPELKGICTMPMLCNCLSVMEVQECPKLTKLPFFGQEQTELPALKLIKGSRKWWEELQRSHPTVIDVYSPCFQEVPEQSAEVKGKCVNDHGEGSSRS